MTSRFLTIASQLVESRYPFTLLSSARRQEAHQAIEIHELAEGQLVHFPGASGRDLLFVVSGDVTVDHPLLDRPVTSGEEGLEKPLFLPPQPYAATVEAISQAVLARVDSKMFDFLLVWDSLCCLDRSDEAVFPKIDGLFSTLPFRDILPEKIEEVFRQMEWVEVNEGDSLEPLAKGTAFCLLRKGEAINGKGEKLDEGSVAGQMVAGEQADFAGGVMTGPGVVLTIGVRRYEEIMAHLVVTEVDAEQAKRFVQSAAGVILDVRHQLERDEGYIPGSVHIPLNELRNGISHLDKEALFVVQCRSGKRSRLAAWFLTKNGYRAVSLGGGVIGWPFDLEGDAY